MRYFFDFEDRCLWNKVTLAEFELNDDAAILLKRALSEPDCPRDADESRLLDALAEVGIRLQDIEEFQGGSRSLQTPIVHVIKCCNSRCCMCDCWKAGKSDFLSAEALLSLWPDVKALGADSVMVSGGEPLLHPQLRQILRDIRSFGLRVELNTNGLLLSRTEWLHEEPPDALIVSLDGYTPEDYRVVRGVDAFEDVLDGVSRFRHASPDVLIGFRSMVTRQTISRLPLSLELLNRTGADVVSFSPVDVASSSFNRIASSNRAQQLTRLLLPGSGDTERYLSVFAEGEETARLVNEACAHGRFSWCSADFRRCLAFYRELQAGTSVSSGTGIWTDEPCNFPRESLLVDYGGEIRTCFYGPKIGLLGDGSVTSWSARSSKGLLRSQGCCRGCRGKVFCDA